MPYDDLPNDGWGKREFDPLRARAWGGIFFGSIAFWAVVAVLIWKWVTS